MSVFPAHAGMSPCGILNGSKKSSFPRSRGDEPSRTIGVDEIARFSPLTRG